MTLRDYAEEILGSKASFRVLRTLVAYRGKVFTVRELARTAGISHPQASRVVQAMERRGIVKLQLVGRAHQVNLNEENYALKTIVDPLFAAEKGTIEALVSTIKPFFDNKRISSVAIFGSVARGTETETSDIDLLIISEDKELANECSAKASTATLSRFGRALSPLILDRDRFIRDRGRWLAKSILARYIRVRGGDLRAMTTVGKASR